MEQIFLRTYKFYNKEGKRLSIFCRHLENDKMEMFVLTCSKQDQFSKKFAIERYKNYTNNNLLYVDKAGVECSIHPYVEVIPILDGKPKATFIKWCKLNYYRRELVPINTVMEYFTKQNVFHMAV